MEKSKYFIDYTGVKYNNITVISYYGKKPNANRHFWNARCDCGEKMIITATKIRKNQPKSCSACRKPNKTHGKTNTRLFYIWQSMKGRCYNENNQDYYNYGARNIKVCDEWLNDFMGFYNWSINNGYNSNLSIDRIDNDKGYCPSNCRWATDIEQANNKKNNIIIEYKGVRDTLPNWARKMGISAGTLQSRYYNNWSVEDMLTIVPKVGRNQYSLK